MLPVLALGEGPAASSSSSLLDSLQYTELLPQ